MNSCIICHATTSPVYNNLFDDRYGAFGKHTIYRCRGCGFGRTIPGLAKDEISRFYSKYYPLLSVDPTVLKKAIHIPSRVILWLKGNDNTTHFHIKPFSTVLDIGSGTGLSLLEIGKIGGRAYGVEPDPNAQRIAKKLHLTVFQGFVTDDPFPKFKFDYITASQVLEHDPTPSSFLIAAKNKLKKNGQIILGFPNMDALYRKIFGRRWLHWHVPFHLNFFTQKSLALLAKSAGLKIVKIRTITPNLWTILQLRMLFSETREGKPNPIWIPDKTKSKGNKALNNLLMNIYMILLPVGNIGIMIINRIVDLLGLGESFLVYLEKDD